MQLVGFFFYDCISFIFCSLIENLSHGLSFPGNIWCHKSFDLLQFFYVLDMGEGIHFTIFEIENLDCIEFSLTLVPFSLPAAAAFFCPCSLCWELPLHVCDGQASVC